MKKKIGVVLGVALVVVMLAAVLVACVPSDPAKAESNLKDEGYKTVKVEGVAAQMVAGMFTDFAEVDFDKVDAIVTGVKGTDSISMLYFKDSSAANDYYNKFEPAYKKTMEESKKEDYAFGKSGSVVYFGTTAAVKAAK